MGALATIEELATFRGLADVSELENEESAEFALELASGLVRDAIGQLLDYVEDDENTERPDGGRVYVLPEAPVHEVAIVEERTFTTWETLTEGTDYEVVLGDDGRLGQLWRLNRDWPMAARARAFGGLVRVTYTHGYAVPGDTGPAYVGIPGVPEAIRLVVLRAAARANLNPDGIRSETVGAYSVTFASDTAPGGFTPVVAGGPYLSNLDIQALAPWVR